MTRRRAADSGGSPRIRHGRVAPLLLAAALLTACASSNEASPFEGESPRAAVTVTVENSNWADVTVYVIPLGGSRHRLGLVTTSRRRSYRVPLDIFGGDNRLRLAADPVGSDDFVVTGALLVHPGDEIIWKIRNADGIQEVQVVGGG